MTFAHASGQRRNDDDCVGSPELLYRLHQEEREQFLLLVLVFAESAPKRDVYGLRFLQSRRQRGRRTID